MVNYIYPANKVSFNMNSELTMQKCVANVPHIFSFSQRKYVMAEQLGYPIIFFLGGGKNIIGKSFTLK